MVFPAQDVKARAIEMGFNLAGVTPAVPSPHLDAYLRWVEAGMHGNMGYLARPDREIRRRDLNVILPGVRSMVLVGLDYRTHLPEALLSDPSRGRIAAYAWNLDYHDTMTPRLEAIADWLQRASGQALSHRVYVDTGAILERSHAHQAGMGFTGKNTMLIHPRRGSYFFLGEILTDLEFDTYDTPGRESMCGRCTRCLSACPTDAFPEPFVLDARRCISYHTIENKGWIEPDLRRHFGNWVYGCDVCQDVCPWQRFTETTTKTDFTPAHADAAAPPLTDLLAMTDDTFRARYRHSPIYRIKRERLVRNACIAAGNWGADPVMTPLRRLLDDPIALVRGHATWALAQMPGQKPTVEAALKRETDPDAFRDMTTTLETIS